MPPSTPTLVFAIAIAAIAQAVAPAWAHAQQAIVLVRHAEKADDSNDPPLSAEGEARAQRLAQVLGSLPVTKLLATKYQRTRRTLAPLAKAIGRDITVVEGSLGDLVREMRAAGPADVVVYAGHSNTVPQALEALGHRDHVVIADAEYSNLFIVVPAATGPPTVLRLRY